MSRFRWLWFVALAGLGLLCSELAWRSVFLRNIAGTLFGHGRLVAIANGRGYYQEDLETQGISAASDLVAVENLRRLAQHEQIDSATVDREFSLLQAQFGEEESFLEAARMSGYSIESFRDRIADQLRMLQWLEREIPAGSLPGQGDPRDWYQKDRESFVEPLRFRASHIFLAAPADASPEVVESQQRQIGLVAGRLARGEALSQLAAEVSEDEATKGRGGDLGFFASARMPADFFGTVEKLAVGQTSGPFRSSLGFHIVKMMESRASQRLSFEEARPEILLALANQRRALIARRLADMLSSATYVRVD